jgi:pyrroline-5-carboxylate reductase
MMRIGFIGAGQMARALASGFVRSQVVAAGELVAADCYEQARSGFAAAIPAATVTADNRQVAEEVDLLWLAVKPQQLAAICAELRPLRPDCLAVSIAAGVSLPQLSEWLATDRVIRVMPNTPCLVAAGASAYCRGAGASAEDGRVVAELLGTVGLCWELPEKLLDAVTGLSGSGPAFVFQFIEALSDGGVLAGLPRQVALELAAQTVLGAAKLVLETGEHPGVLKDRVASPAGTTIAGLQALEQGGLRAAVMNAVHAAARRSEELGRTPGS